MTILPVVIKGQTLQKGNGFPEVVEKSKDWLSLEFEGLPTNAESASVYFELSWEYGKTYDALITNNSCVIPEYCTTLPKHKNEFVDYVVYVSVAAIVDGKRFTTDKLEIKIDQTAYKEKTENTPELPESQYEQFVGETESYAKRAEEAAKRAEDAANQSAEIVVPDNSITSTKIVDGAVTTEKTNFVSETTKSIIVFSPADKTVWPNGSITYFMYSKNGDYYATNTDGIEFEGGSIDLSADPINEDGYILYPVIFQSDEVLVLVSETTNFYAGYYNSVTGLDIKRLVVSGNQIENKAISERHLDDAIVTMDKLSDDVKQLIEDAGNIDLSNYYTKPETDAAIKNVKIGPSNLDTQGPASIYNLPNTKRYEGILISANSQNQMVQSSKPALNTVRIDIEDFKDYGSVKIVSDAPYVRASTTFYRLAVAADSNEIQKTVLYNQSYEGDIVIDVSSLPANYRYIYIVMEKVSEVGLSIDGIKAEMPEWTGVPQLEKQMADAETRLDEAEKQIAEIKEQIPKDSTPILVLPRKAVAVVGHEFNMYYRNVVICDNLDNYYVSCSISPSSAFTKETAKTLGDCLRITPAEGNVGTYPVTVRIKDKMTGENVAEGSFTLHVIADSSVTGKKVLFIGDSLTDAGIYPAEIQHNLSNGGIVSLGTRSDTVNIGGVSLTVNHEGRSGWASYDYTRSVANFRTDVSNPFWNESAGAFDFAYYMDQQGYSNVDVVCINLGTNGVSNTATVPAIDEMIESIHAYDSNIKVVVSLITQGATQDGFGDKVGIMSGRGFDLDSMRLVQQYIAKYDGIENNVDVSELYFCLDKMHDFDTKQVAVSARNPAVVTIQTNNVHPSVYGYLKFADVYYNNVLYHLTKE